MTQTVDDKKFLACFLAYDKQDDIAESALDILEENDQENWEWVVWDDPDTHCMSLAVFCDRQAFAYLYDLDAEKIPPESAIVSLNSAKKCITPRSAHKGLEIVSAWAQSEWSPAKKEHVIEESAPVVREKKTLPLRKSNKSVASQIHKSEKFGDTKVSALDRLMAMKEAQEKEVASA